MTILPKATYRFNAMPIKLWMKFFTELKQNNYNFYGDTKDPKEPKQSSETKMELEEWHALTWDYTTKL